MQTLHTTSDVNKDLGLKAKAKDLSHKAKAKDLDFGLKDQGQGQGLTSLHTTVLTDTSTDQLGLPVATQSVQRSRLN